MVLPILFIQHVLFICAALKIRGLGDFPKKTHCDLCHKYTFFVTSKQYLLTCVVLGGPNSYFDFHPYCCRMGVPNTQEDLNGIEAKL